VERPALALVSLINGLQFAQQMGIAQGMLVGMPKVGAIGIVHQNTVIVGQ